MKVRILRALVLGVTAGFSLAALAARHPSPMISDRPDPHAVADSTQKDWMVQLRDFNPILRALIDTPEKTRTDDVAGLEAAKKMLAELIGFQKDPVKAKAASYDDSNCACGPGQKCTEEFLIENKIVTSRDQFEPDEKSSKGYRRVKASVMTPLEVCQGVNKVWQAREQLIPQGCLDSMRKCGPFRLTRNIEILRSNVALYQKQIGALDSLIRMKQELAADGKVGEQTSVDGIALKDKKLKLIRHYEFQVIDAGIPDPLTQAN